MKRVEKNILEALAASDSWVSFLVLPDGNGRRGGANMKVLRAMIAASLVTEGKSVIVFAGGGDGYKITDAGREALASA